MTELSVTALTGMAAAVVVFVLLCRAKAAGRRAVACNVGAAILFVAVVALAGVLLVAGWRGTECTTGSDEVGKCLTEWGISRSDWLGEWRQSLALLSLSFSVPAGVFGYWRGTVTAQQEDLRFRQEQEVRLFGEPPSVTLTIESAQLVAADPDRGLSAVISGTVKVACANRRIRLVGASITRRPSGDEHKVRPRIVVKPINREPGAGLRKDEPDVRGAPLELPEFLNPGETASSSVHVPLSEIAATTIGFDLTAYVRTEVDDRLALDAMEYYRHDEVGRAGLNLVTGRSTTLHLAVPGLPGAKAQQDGNGDEAPNGGGTR